MPIFEASEFYPHPIDTVFLFLRSPANLVAISPPDFHLRVIEGPELVELGSRVVLQGRRWGISQRVVSLITVFKPPVRFTDSQVEGPFRKWDHTHRFEAVAGATRVSDDIEYEPPGGMLGLVVTAARIESDLGRVFEYRAKKLAELLGGGAI